MGYDGVSVDLSTGVTQLFMEERVLTGPSRFIIIIYYSSKGI